MESLHEWYIAGAETAFRSGGGGGGGGGLIRPNKLNSQFIVTTSSNFHEGGRSLFIIHYCYCIALFDPKRLTRI